MLNKYLFILLGVVSIVCWHDVTAQSIEIQYHDKSSTRAFLVKANGLALDTVLSCELKEGACKVKCKDCSPGLYELSIAGSQESNYLVLGKSNIKIKFESDRAKPKFENSEASMLLHRILAHNGKYHQKRDSLSRAGQTIYEFDPYFKKKAEIVRNAYDQLHEWHNLKLEEFAAQTSDQYILDVLIPVLKFTILKDGDKSKYDNERAFQHYEFFQHIDFLKQQLAGDPFFAKKLSEYLTYFGGRSLEGKQESCELLINMSSTNQQLQTFIVGILMETYYKMQDLDMVEFVSRTASCEPPEQLSWELKNYIEQTKGLQPGNKAPEISIKDQAGKVRSLSSIVTVNEYTIVFFWATWCAHCVEVLPQLVDLYPELKSDGAEVFAVSLDDNYEDWVLSLAEYDTPWVNVSERKRWDTKAVADYNIRATPTFYLLKKDMTIVGKYIILEDLQKALSLN